MNISDIKDKTAEALLIADLDQDKDHLAIQNAAAALVAKNKKKARFLNVFNSGATTWETDDDAFIVLRKDWIEA